jgi:serine phosphatase RsbU (regulator of sigma subunit)
MSLRFLVLSQFLLCTTGVGQFSISIDALKDAWYSQRTASAEGYIHLSPSDFLPLSGPKPDDESDLSADVWVAWDEKYFYLYAEVKDDVVHVGSAVRPWNDCVELKFDPDPSQHPLVGIVNARVSALDSAEAADPQGVDNLYPERDSVLTWSAASPAHYARRRTEDGYAVELRLAWEWITCKGRVVHAGVGELFGFAASIHDNDNTVRRRGLMEREGTIQWSAGMADDVWLVPQLLGTVEFRPDHVLRLTRRNAIDSSDCRATTFLSDARFNYHSPYPITVENWRYHPGDSPEWADPSFDDRAWEITYARFTERQKPESDWQGFGWFRARLVVDSSLWSVPLGYSVSHAGACEVYLDGTRLAAFGDVATADSSEKSYFERNPRTLVFRQMRDHLLAVRYSSAMTNAVVARGGDAGFAFVLTGDLNRAIQNRTDAVRQLTVSQVLFPVVALTLGGLHLLLFLFLPRHRVNLYFALFMIVWGTFIWLSFQQAFLASVDAALDATKLTGTLLGSAFIFGLLAIYAGFLPRIPKIGYALIAACVIFAALALFTPYNELLADYVVYVLIGVVTIELFRVFVIAGRERRRERWVAALGFMAFMLSLVYEVLIELSVLTRVSSVDMVIVGTLVLSVCFSIDLSRNFAKTSKNLAEQLIRVQQFSRQAIESERLAREEELARRMLEADNARKTSELEEARQVQLSMLPKDVPKIPHVDIAVEMETASEIGGDYYDFHVGDDGTLTVALGDATGHGAKAGTMVSVTKGLFHEFASLSSFQAIFERFTKAFKHMNLGQLYMALLLVRLKDHTITASSAGMPPILIYRSATGLVDRLVTKGMPLGVLSDFPYQTRETTLSSGDVVLLMSDGYLEMFNSNDETLDEPRAVESFREAAAHSPQDIIMYLLQKGREWAGGRPQVDDVTFVVMKMV